MAELLRAGQRLQGNCRIFPVLLMIQECLQRALRIIFSEGNQGGTCAEGTGCQAYFFGTYVGLVVTNLGSRMRKVKISSSLQEKNLEN